MRIDLHTHSRVSDGTDTPTELVHAALAADLDVVAITDHDTTAGWDEALTAAGDVGITLVPGIEVSTRHDGHGAHLLAYLPDPTYTPLIDELGKILDGRAGRLPLMVERLREIDIDITVDEVLVGAGEAAASGRPHVADALVAKGVVKDRDEGFRRFLGPGKPAYVHRYAAPLTTTIELVAAAGGVSVLAHPWGRSRRQQPDEAGLAALQEVGLTGIEVDHQDHQPDVRRQLRAIARNLDLVVTGASDYHGTGKVNHDLGVNTTAPEQFERLIDAARKSAAASGRDVPRLG